MTQYGFFFNGTRCTGCKACEMACKDYNDLTTRIAFRQVFEYGGGTWALGGDGTYENDVFAYFVSTACNHCANPACVPACPVQSMVKHEATGLVYNDPDTCVGCGSCVEACPYGVPKVEAGRNVSVKCDGCHGRVEQGLKPICVDACPLRALDFGDINQLCQEHGGVAAVAPLPDPSLTGPSVVIEPCRQARDFGDTEGAVLNADELV